MDNSPDLAFFCFVSRKGSLSAAAREMGLTPSAVSKRLAQLERRLGAQLLNRTTRRITLTNEGELYLARATRILSEIEELERLVAGNRAAPKGLLRINATLTFGRTPIAPIISDFVKIYPEVTVQLQLTDRPLNLSAEGYDIGIRFGELPDTRLAARRIAQNRRLLCASPAYIEKAGAPTTPADLAHHNCIIIRQEDDAYGTLRFTNGARTETVKVRGALSTNDPEVALTWALDGHGIVVRSEWDVARYLRTGLLRRVLEDRVLPAADIHAVYPQRHNVPAKVRAFIDYLVACFEARTP
ncbi:MAG: LysR family transcriptional regulator [Burkholderiales bacterium]|nr:LysR family transcriptional regulator [Burkholderiales bacterium]